MEPGNLVSVVVFFFFFRPELQRMPREAEIDGRPVRPSGLGAYIHIAAYYVIGLPVGMFVTFAGPKWGLNGTSLSRSLSVF